MPDARASRLTTAKTQRTPQPQSCTIASLLGYNPDSITCLQIRKYFPMSHTRRDFLGAVSAAAAVGMVHSQAQGAFESNSKPLGVAIVGLGSQSQQVLDASCKWISSSPWCTVAGLVSSDLHKAQAYATKVGLSKGHIYSYETFDKIASDESIDIVYIAVPNAMHCEFALRAAKAGKHVFCESPMAIDSKQCRSMIRACQDNHRALAVASSPLPRIIDCFGHIRSIEASQSLSIDPKSAWRLDRELCGGGALFQVGIDVLRTQRLWVDSTPVWVIAQETKTDAKRFATIDESVTWSLGFASGTIAHGAVSLNYSATGHLAVQAQRCSMSSDFPPANHYWSRADQIESFAAAIQGKSLLPPDAFNSLDAESALEDILLAEAILRSIKQRSQVQLG